MKLLQIVLVFSILLASCNSEKTKNTSSGEPMNESISEAAKGSEGNEFPYNQHAIWAFDGMKDTIIKLHEVERDTLSPEKLVELLNLDFQNQVQCEFIEINNDTAFVRIPDSEYLTQKMGSTGAYEYMVAATFTLTELEGVEFVDFDFKVGDHAVPGTYSRQQFLDEIMRNKRPNN